jgi:hypothetical protein
MKPSAASRRLKAACQKLVAQSWLLATGQRLAASGYPLPATVRMNTVSNQNSECIP